MSEEIQNAALVVPRAIMAGLMINGSLGFAIILTVLFRAGDIEASITENSLYLFIAIFEHAINSTAGAAVMASLIFCLGTSGCVGLLASTSRILWAFSRDRGLPGWRTWTKVRNHVSYGVIIFIYLNRLVEGRRSQYTQLLLQL